MVDYATGLGFDPAAGKMTRILIIDDHPLFREALQSSIIRMMPKMQVFEACNLDEAISTMRAVGRFNLALLDLFMPKTRGFEGLLTLRSLHPTLPVVVVSGQEDPKFVREALNYGAAGFIPKSFSKEEIADALQDILAGNVFVPKDMDIAARDPQEKERQQLARRLTTLTRQQIVVMRMLKEGKLNKQIAFELGLSETTIKSHVSEILRKLNVVSRTQAVIEVNKIEFDAILLELDEIRLSKDQDDNA